MYERYDVVVVGGGPSGSMAAKTLAEAGVKVCILERSFRQVKPCGGATPSTSFEEFDLPRHEIVREVREMSTISPEGQKIDVLLNNGYLAMVERETFDNVLRKKAEDSGAHLIEAEFIGLRDTHRIQLIITNEKGMEREIKSDFLIAADGVNSRIATLLGLKSLPCVFTIQEDLDMAAAEDFHELNRCEFWFSSRHAPNFYSWVFPKKDYIDIGTASLNGRLLKEFIKNFKIRRGILGNGRQRVYRLPLRWRDTLVRGRILFIGDAAGLVMPLSYEGIYYAMKSGKMAAEAIVNGRPRDYEKQWNRRFRKHFKLMNRLRRYFMRNDRTIEQMVSIHKRREVQEASMRLWLKKDTGVSSFLGYFSFFRRLLN
jgi:geranylgeranyl reductase